MVASMQCMCDRRWRCGNADAGRAWHAGGSSWALLGRGRDIRWVLVGIGVGDGGFRGMMLLPGELVVRRMDKGGGADRRCGKSRSHVRMTEISEKAVRTNVHKVSRSSHLFSASSMLSAYLDVPDSTDVSNLKLTKAELLLDTGNLILHPS